MTIVGSSRERGYTQDQEGSGEGYLSCYSRYCSCIIFDTILSSLFYEIVGHSSNTNAERNGNRINIHTRFT